MDATRTDSPSAFLQEAVYRSRTQQAAIAAVAPDAGCGLGARPAVVLSSTPAGGSCSTPSGRRAWNEAALARVREALRAWVRAQDALDRRRDHFLKAFRQEHGFDRRAYAPDVLAAYESGLEAINAEALAAQRAAARSAAGGAPERPPALCSAGRAEVAKSADARDLGSRGATRGGSSPPFRTTRPTAPGERAMSDGTERLGRGELAALAVELGLGSCCSRPACGSCAAARTGPGSGSRWPRPWPASRSPGS